MLILAPTAVTPPAAPEWVQGIISGILTASPVTVTFNNPVTPGNAVMVGFMNFTSAAQITAMSDDGGNTYTSGVYNQPGSILGLQGLYGLNIQGNAQTISGTVSVATGAWVLWADEYSGFGSKAYFTNCSTSITTGIPIVPDNVSCGPVASVAGDFIYGILATNNPYIMQAGTGYVLRRAQFFAGGLQAAMAAENMLVAPGGSQLISFSSPATGNRFSTSGMVFR